MNNFPTRSVLWLLLSVVSAGSMAYYVLEIWGANQPPHFSDLYAPWWAAHELLLHRRNPYSPAVAHEIQTMIYGAPATASADDPSSIGGGFAYPPYAALLLWPTVYLSFSAAQKVFLVFSVLAMVLSLALWLRMLSCRPSPLRWLTLAFFALGSFPALQALQLQNLSVIAAALIALTLFLLAGNHLVLAGILLAFSTFKPQFLVVLLVWLGLWTISDWRRRRPMAWSFLATMLLLILTSEWLVPRWMHSFLNVLRAYRQYTYGHSLLDVWFTPTWGPPLAGCLLLLAFALCWKCRLQQPDSMEFASATILFLALTLIMIPTLAPHTQLLLLPGFLLLVGSGAASPMSGMLRRLAFAAAWTLLAWSWIAACGLLLASIRLPLSTLLRFWDVPLYTSPLLPLAVCLATASLLLNPSYDHDPQTRR